ncbi:hypothetical protein HFN89_00070 [Rhizobium laguerreae]|nr:hypothetical protein [Rhizobium laguerreae]
MGLELSRRSLFKGLLAASAFRFLPAVPMTAPAAPAVARTFNPFAIGSSSSLTEMVLALMEETQQVETIAVVRSIPCFRVEMLDDIGNDESVSDVLTRHLGEGEWSEWTYSADDVRDALSSLDYMDQLHRQAIGYFMGANDDQVEASTIEVMTELEAEVGLPAAA